ncbi:hypothetical protein [Lysobacter gummosus]
MKRQAICERTIRGLCNDWRSAAGRMHEPADKLCFEDFHRWLHEHHPDKLRARRGANAAFWLRLWFEQEVGVHGPL